MRSTAARICVTYTYVYVYLRDVTFIYRGEPVAAAAGHGTAQRPLMATVVHYHSESSLNSVPVAVRSRETHTFRQNRKRVFEYRVFKYRFSTLLSVFLYVLNCFFFEFFLRLIFCRLKIRHGISINTICSSPCRSTHSNTTINTHNFITYIHIYDN